MSNLSELQANNRGAWTVIRLLQCIRGPKLRRLNYIGRSNEGVAYTPNKLEHYADNVIVAARMLWSFALYTTPLYLFYYLIRHGIPSPIGVLTLFRNLAFIPISFSLAYIVRGVGRFRNQTYIEFLRTLNSVKRLNTKIGPSEEKMTGIGGYDFDVNGLPITFCHDESTVKPLKVTGLRRKSLGEKIIHFPLSSLRFLAAHFVGRRLIYPGSLDVFNMLLGTHLSVGRAKFKRNYDAYRARLLAVGGNTIDCMFVDKRGSPDVTAKGNKVVICCEGNAAFYELGMMEIPLSCGYSVIGWNHPGFGDSTGLPFPEQEFNAIDVVIRFTVSQLGFAFEDIILFAWSIGGYTASCAAMSYPDIGAVVIDASFDELFPLVKARVTPYLHSFCHGMVSEYYNLNIAEQLCRYHGPVLVVRRMSDEMMSEMNDPGTNRGNYILIQLLQTRYPNIVNSQTLPTLWQWLRAVTESDRSSVSARVNRRSCSTKLQLYMAEHGPSYPWTIGGDMSQDEKTEMLLFLAEQYMSNFDGQHCTPLPREYFRVPSAGNYSI